MFLQVWIVRMKDVTTVAVNFPVFLIVYQKLKTENGEEVRRGGRSNINYRLKQE